MQKNISFLRQRISTLKNSKLNKKQLQEIEELEKELDTLENISTLIPTSNIQNNWFNECPIKTTLKQSRIVSAEDKKFNKLAKEYLNKKLDDDQLFKKIEVRKNGEQNGVQTLVNVIKLKEKIQDSKVSGYKKSDLRDLAFYYCHFLLSYIYWNNEIDKKWKALNLHEKLSNRLVEQGASEIEMKWLIKLENAQLNNSDTFRELIQECPFELP